ncbi:MAG TPA: CDP-alcohol phosphatidyltransferase family protein [Phycisphaerales bacterium]|nr:CDP-alcohol phosphatidyltransferase family protein [Phycisphaerales bacterium]
MELDRRPIAARSLGSMRWLAARLAAWDISPNAVSGFGLVFGLAAGGLLVLTGFRDHAGPDGATRVILIIAAACIQLRLLCNLLDGLVAVEFGKQSALGDVWNEAPDRLADVAILVGAGYAWGSNPSLGWAAAVGALFVAYLRTLGKSLGLPGDFRGPMAKQQRMFIVTLGTLVVALTPPAGQHPFAQWRPTDAGYLSIGLAVIILGCVITAARRLSGLCRLLRARSAGPNPN